MEPSEEERERIATLFPAQTTIEANPDDLVIVDAGGNGSANLSIWFWGNRHAGTIRIVADKRQAVAAALLPPGFVVMERERAERLLRFARAWNEMPPISWEGFGNHWDNEIEEFDEAWAGVIEGDMEPIPAAPDEREGETE